MIFARSLLTIFAAMVPLVTVDSPADEWVTCMSFNWILVQFLFGCAVIGLIFCVPRYVPAIVAEIVIIASYMPFIFIFLTNPL